MTKEEIWKRIPLKASDLIKIKNEIDTYVDSMHRSHSASWDNIALIIQRNFLRPSKYLYNVKILITLNDLTLDLGFGYKKKYTTPYNNLDIVFFGYYRCDDPVGVHYRFSETYHVAQETSYSIK